jgi:hypothetical protein
VILDAGHRQLVVHEQLLDCLEIACTRRHHFHGGENNKRPRLERGLRITTTGSR